MTDQDDFDYRTALAELDEYCNYLDQILEEEITTMWKMLKRTDSFIIFQNDILGTRTISAEYINNVFKE